MGNQVQLLAHNKYTLNR